jgi:regulatory protein
MIRVSEYKAAEKGKLHLSFDNGTTMMLYRSEASKFHLQQDAALSESEFSCLLHDVVGKRAKKRALHLLEQMDRTEHQLRQKLALGGYPQECIDSAIAYVKSYHYLDDYRYACTFVRYAQEKMSRRQILGKLSAKGISREVMSRALEDTYEASETEQIRELLQKRRFVPGQSDETEFRRTYQYLMRRGFSSGDVLRAMK